MITFPADTIMNLHETSPLLALVRVGAFVLKTTGTMLFKCLISKRRQKKKDAKFETKMEEIGNAVMNIAEKCWMCKYKMTCIVTLIRN